jgi:hypothetical protein
MLMLFVSGTLFFHKKLFSTLHEERKISKQITRQKRAQYTRRAMCCIEGRNEYAKAPAGDTKNSC